MEVGAGRVCGPPGNARCMGKHGGLGGRKHLGAGATASMQCRGLWMYWDHWSSGYWHRYKTKSLQTQRGWRRCGLDMGNVGVAVRSSYGHTHRTSQPFSGRLPSKRIIPDPHRRISSGKMESRKLSCCAIGQVWALSMCRHT